MNLTKLSSRSCTVMLVAKPETLMTEVEVGEEGAEGAVEDSLYLL